MAATSSSEGASRPCSNARARTVSISACAARGPGPPGDHALHGVMRLWLTRAAGAHKVQNRIDHALTHGHPAQQLLRGDQLGGGEHLMRGILGRAGGGDQDIALCLAVGIVYVNLHKEPVQLRFGQGVGAFLL